MLLFIIPLNSLDISIYQVEDISREPQVERELLLMKLNADSSTRAEVMTELCFKLSFNMLTGNNHFGMNKKKDSNF